ncbi:MAG: branched-chain amino acid ABC transporter permease [Oscillospiraceae bacterium]|jgi:branched-chain amino acid transport system permease protein|nr:branched-chain amino acid ABC transporter permease [Oscillospiraceae bacterium]
MKQKQYAEGALPRTRQRKITSTLLTVALLAALAAALYALDTNASSLVLRIVRLCAINVVLALAMNLINGFTGIFSLGQAGFMAIGAYATALLTIPAAKKAMIFMITPLAPPLDQLTLPFGTTLLIGGLLAAGAAFLVGVPCLRLRGDYLAIATLGFSEIIRVLITNAQGLTNGAQGLKNIPPNATVWWCYGTALVVVIFMALFTTSSYGRALKAIREDEIAAESMGVSLFRHKMLAFMLSAFLAGMGGGLLAAFNGTIGQDMFRVMQTYNVLMIVVMGGMGSISGSVFAAFVVTIGQEWLRVLDGPMTIGPFHTDGISGLRMVVFSMLLLVIIIFFRNGLLGTKEVTWASIGRRLSAMAGHKRKEAAS